MRQNHTWRDGNRVELLINGEGFYPRVFDSIRKAREEVLLETFIIAEDKIGRQLQQALIVAAKAGARVEVMVDGYGTFDLSTPFLTEMVDAGVTLRVFDPSPRMFGMRTNMFRRLHRKIVVVDNKIAYVGGINFSEEHIAEFGDMAKQDYAVEIHGPLVADIYAASLNLLREATPEQNGPIDIPSVTTEGNAPAGDTKMLIAVRDNNRHKADIEHLYLQAITSAKKRIVIANAYFFPGYRLLRALRNASRRGLEVLLIMQGQPDMPWVSACSRALYNYLLKEGVTILEYGERPFHGKVALVDDEWVTIGSSNLDPLSLAMNLEANVFIKDKAFNEQLYSHLKDLAAKSCKPISLERIMRGYWWRLPFVFICFHFARYFPAIAGWLPAHTPVLQPVKPEELQDDSDNKPTICEQEKTV